MPPISRRKLPSGSNSEDLFDQSMAVDLHLLTNSKNKRQKRVSQLDEYFDALLSNYTSASEQELKLLKQP